MTWGWPQWVIAVLLVAEGLLGVAKNASQGDAVSAVIYPCMAAAVVWVLYMGGFWS